MISLVIGFVGAPSFGEIFMLQLGNFAMGLFISTQPIVNDCSFILLQTLLSRRISIDNESGEMKYRALYAIAHSSKGSATNVWSSLEMDLWAWP